MTDGLNRMMPEPPGAMAETGQKFQSIDYVESHLFNSSKCFGIFPCA